MREDVQPRTGQTVRFPEHNGCRGCWQSDRFAVLRDGRVQAAGVGVGACQRDERKQSSRLARIKSSGEAVLGSRTCVSEVFSPFLDRFSPQPARAPRPIRLRAFACPAFSSGPCQRAAGLPRHVLLIRWLTPDGDAQPGQAGEWGQANQDLGKVPGSVWVKCTKPSAASSPLAFPHGTRSTERLSVLGDGDSPPVLTHVSSSAVLKRCRSPTALKIGWAF